MRGGGQGRPGAWVRGARIGGRLSSHQAGVAIVLRLGDQRVHHDHLAEAQAERVGLVGDRRAKRLGAVAVAVALAGQRVGEHRLDRLASREDAVGALAAELDRRLRLRCLDDAVLCAHAALESVELIGGSCSSSRHALCLSLALCVGLSVGTCLDLSVGVASDGSSGCSHALCAALCLVHLCRDRLGAVFGDGLEPLGLGQIVSRRRLLLLLHRRRRRPHVDSRRRLRLRIRQQPQPLQVGDDVGAHVRRVDLKVRYHLRRGHARRHYCGEARERRGEGRGGDEKRGGSGASGILLRTGVEEGGQLLVALDLLANPRLLALHLLGVGDVGRREQHARLGRRRWRGRRRSRRLRAVEQRRRG